MLIYAYISKAKEDLSREEISSLLVTARGNNFRREITGALILSEGIFLQIIEGSADSIHNLISSIQQDDRHRQMTPIYMGSTGHRYFKNWTMLFRALSHEQMEMIVPGFEQRLEIGSPLSAYLQSSSLDIKDLIRAVRQVTF